MWGLRPPQLNRPLLRPRGIQGNRRSPRYSRPVLGESNSIPLACSLGALTSQRFLGVLKLRSFGPCLDLGPGSICMPCSVRRRGSMGAIPGGTALGGVGGLDSLAESSMNALVECPGSVENLRAAAIYHSAPEVQRPPPGHWSVHVFWMWNGAHLPGQVLKFSMT